MALHWQHIVGVNGSAPTYTEIKFDDGSDKKTPVIKTGTNPKDLTTEWGNIATTQSTTPFTALQTFSGGINTTKWDIGSNTQDIATVKGQQIVYQLTKGAKWQTQDSKDLFEIGTSQITSKQNFAVGSCCTIAYSDGDITTQGIITAKGSTSYVQAPYFNATSDRRAKDNIRPLTTSALDWINNTTIYSFNYLANPESTVGVIAQELYPLGDVSFVKNVAATGENGDYMSVTESKLVYVALKAIQELSKKVEDLQNELRSYRQSQ